MRIAFAAGVLVMGVTTLAQELTGSLSGTVTDTSGAVMERVRIRVSGLSLVRDRVVSTGVDGIFRVPALPPGMYALEAAKAEFRTVSAGDIRVSIGQATQVDLRLDLATVKGAVQVNSVANGIDPRQSAISENVPASLGDRLPRTRSFDSLLPLAPGVRAESKSGQYQVDGASGSENAFTVEGVEVSDIYSGLLLRNFQLPLEFIQEVRIQSSGFEAQYPAATGGVVTVVLRSGGNGFHGRGLLYMQTDALNAGPRQFLMIDPSDDGRALTIRPPRDGLRVLNPSGTIGGPIQRNRIWFHAGMAPEFSRVARTVKPFSGGEAGTYTRTERNDLLSSKLDFAPAERLRLYGSFQHSPSEVRGRLPAVEGTDNPANDFASPGFRLPASAYRAGVDYNYSSRLFLSARGGFNYTNYKDTGIPTAPFIRYRTANLNLPGVPDRLRAPAGEFSANNYQSLYSKLNRLNINLDAAYRFSALGRHDLRAGFSRNQLYHQVSAGFSGGLFVIFWNASYSNSLTGEGPMRGPFGYYIYRRSGIYGDVSSDNSGFYLQDTWQLGRVAVNTGFRMDREFVPSYRSDNGLNPRPISFGFPQKFAPRLGVSWDVLGTGKWKVAGSYGRYFDQMKYALPISSLGGAQWKDYVHSLDDPDIGKLTPANVPGALFATIDYRVPLSSENGSRIDPKLEPFRKHSFDFFSEHVLTRKWTARARYNRNRLDRTVEHVGLPVSGGLTGFLGNPGYNATATPGFTGPGMAPTPKAARNYDSAEFRVTSSLLSAWFVSASYTYSRLWGNYSGLASSDEFGRAEPNVTQTFDSPWATYDARGQAVYGLLPTDRPHVFKSYLSYSMTTRWGITTLAPVVQALSGTPVSTRARVMTMQTFPDGRGDLGRTPFFTNTDRLVRQEFRLGGGSEKGRLRLEAHILNLWNQANITEVNPFYIHPNDGGIGFGNPADYFRGFDFRKLASTQGLRVSPLFGSVGAYQSAREIRLGLGFSF